MQKETPKQENHILENQVLGEKELSSKSIFDHGAICDMCDEWITVCRYKCSVCDVRINMKIIFEDFDCCEKCLKKWDFNDSKAKTFHPWTHLFFKIMFPLPPKHLRPKLKFSEAQYEGDLQKADSSGFDHFL